MATGVNSINNTEKKDYRCKQCHFSNTNNVEETKEKRWISIQEYLALLVESPSLKLCSYSPLEGTHKNLLCASVISQYCNDLKFRCEECYNYEDGSTLLFQKLLHFYISKKQDVVKGITVKSHYDITNMLGEGWFITDQIHSTCSALVHYKKQGYQLTVYGLFCGKLSDYTQINSTMLIHLKQDYILDKKLSSLYDVKRGNITYLKNNTAIQRNLVR